MMEKTVVSSLRTYAWAHSKRRGTNGDGFIDLEEKQVAKEKKQAKRQADKKAEQQALREKHQQDRKKAKKHFYKY
jgi:hypothetical protein